MTFVQLQMSGLESMESLPKKSRLFPQASRVSLTALRERVGAIVTSVTCGEKLKELSERLDRAGLSVKIRPVYFQERINGISGKSFPTLPRWGITSGGEYGALATWERRTSGSGCSLWRTPTASDGEFSGRSSERLADRWENQKQKHLSEQVVYAELQGGGVLYTRDVSNTFINRCSTGEIQRGNIEGSRRTESSERIQERGTQFDRVCDSVPYVQNKREYDSSGEWWEVEPDVGRVAHGVPARVDRLRGIGNAVVPYQALPIFEAIAEYELSQRLS